MVNTHRQVFYNCGCTVFVEPGQIISERCLLHNESLSSGALHFETAPETLKKSEGGIVVGVKHDDGKLRFDLIPTLAEMAEVRVLMHGAKKYGDNNWRILDDRRRRYFNAQRRHMTAWWSGETNDPESGESHLAHARCSIGFLLDEEEAGKR